MKVVRTRMTPELSPLPPRTAGNQEKTRRPLLRFALFVLLLGFIGGSGYAGYLYYQYDKMLDKTSIPDTKEEIPDPLSAKSKPMAILLLGLDTRGETGSLNTDAIMVAALHPGRKSATIVSIPRDTFLKPEGYRGRKANAFYSLAVRYAEQPEQEIKNIFGNYLDIPIDYVSIVHFKTFEDIIDRLGGISVDVDMDMRYVDNADGTDINLTKGFQKLDGKHALDFVRYRQSNRGTEPSSDFQRNERQQKVIAAVVDQMKSVTAPFKIGGIFEAIGDNIKTDIQKKQLKSFIRTYLGISNDNIEYIPLQAEWRSPYSYIQPNDLENAQKKLQEQLK
jgi:LCP family protein required for cell wall assembly